MVISGLGMEEQMLFDILKQVSFKDETFHAKDKVWEAIQHKVKLTRKWNNVHFAHWSIAAAVAALICVYIGISSNKEIIGDNNGGCEATLADGSTVILEPQSSIHYNQIKWWFKRELKLQGNATFKVTKGSKFSVLTDKGTISVLGTQFFISQQKNMLHVACYEGVVRVDTKVGSEKLLAGEQVDFDSKNMKRSRIEEETVSEYLEYLDAPLLDVARKIEELYNIQIVNVEMCQGYTYSGLLSTQNRDEALEIVFASCGLNYSLEGNQLTLRH